MPDAGGRAARDLHPLGPGVGLAHGHQERGGVQRAGAGQQPPLVDLAGARPPGRGADRDACPGRRELPVLAGEADVVTDAQPDPHAVDGHHAGRVPGLDGVGLGEPERVEQVDLVVAQVQLAVGSARRVAPGRSGHQEGVADAAALTGREHADDDDDPVLLSDLGHLGRPRAVEGLRDLVEPARPEGTHGGLGQRHDPGPPGSGLGHGLADQPEVVGGVASGQDLGCGDAHGGPPGALGVGRSPARLSPAGLSLRPGGRPRRYPRRSARAARGADPRTARALRSQSAHTSRPTTTDAAKESHTWPASRIGG